MFVKISSTLEMPKVFLFMKPENLLRKKIMFKIIKFQNLKHGCFGMNSYPKYYPKVMLNLKNRSPIASESRIKTN